MDPRLVRQFQRHALNPAVRALFDLGIVPPGYALLETIGRRSGRRRRTPVGDGLVGDTFWVVAEFGRRAAYVQNLIAEPSVRVQIRQGRKLVWRTGTATLAPDDDPVQRQRRLSATGRGRRLNAAVVRTVGTDLTTVRIDLDR